MTQRKIGIISSLYGNSQYLKDEKGPAERAKLIEQLEESFDNAIVELFKSPSEKESDEINWDDPFMAPVKRSYEKRGIKHDVEVPEDSVVSKVDPYEGLEIDQQ